MAKLNVGVLVRQLSLDLTEEDANWLRSVMQNPLLRDGQDVEDCACSAVRERIFEALKEGLTNG